jgi:enhancer of polycomb-like protein
LSQFDETNDGDPYVCFRRRDIRATRKTRRTDNFSVEQMQKLQTELRSAHQLAQMVVKREQEKKTLYKAEKEVWEAKWKLLETKRRWPSLGITREEEEIITGRPTGVAVQPGPTLNVGMLSGNVLHQQSGNLPIRKKVPEKEREERERREKAAEAAKAAEKGVGIGRWYAPEEVKSRMLALTQRLEEEMRKKKEADAQWDDATDVSRNIYK